MDKICTKCKESKPATTEYFFSDKVLKSGLRAKCKTCMTKLNKEYLKTHSEKIKQQNRERYHANKEQYSHASFTFCS